ncbi:FH1/FH2 domain-containing protein 3 [Araneus ventricosus]|uniref:FH1/FH2 domain-containing protein 3 n=1 Tax=Araneus ventricosus TaxID=182803 RepID=A0A4Y2T1W5_ARAVE|nr:FH1/FH2 domain-containing protein 3 [Araneus ventricosus]
MPSIGTVPWSNIWVSAERFSDMELLVYAVTLINKTLNGVPDQDTYYDIVDHLEEQGMENVIQYYMSKQGTDLDLLQQFQIYEPTLSLKQAHFYEWPKRVMSVFRRPDLRSQPPKSIFSPPRKSSPCSFMSSSKILSLSILALLFLTLIFCPLGKRSKASSRILVNLVGGVYFSEPLLVPYLLVLLISQAGSQAGDK